MYKEMGEDLTSRLELAVACARTGRILARIGAYLTNTEQEQISEIYSRLHNKEKINEESPVMGLITSKVGKKGKISQSDAIKWFIQKYPKWSLPLQKKSKESKPPKIKTILAYGLKEGKDFNDEYYVNVIKDVTNLPEEQVRDVYELLIKPQLAELEELSGLIETEIKK